MTTYLIARVTVHNAERYSEYTRHTPRIINEFGGRFIARGGEVTTLEGPQETARVVVLEFPDEAAATGFYNSDGYSRAKAIRAGVADFQLILLNDIPHADWLSALETSQQIDFD